MHHYNEFDTNDFIDDPFFAAWVRNPTTEIDTKWRQWLKENPHKAECVQEARTILQRMSFARHQLSDRKVSALWKKIEDKATAPVPAKEVAMRSSFYTRHRWKIAASIAFVFLTSLSLLMKIGGSAEVIYATASGETREITLLDQSVIVLNENSELRLARDFMKSDSREVWIKGEGFFEVSKQFDEENGYKPFIVHLGNARVKVLGTSFNIQEKDGMSEVVLQTGSVQVTVPERDEQYTLVPGDLISIKDGHAEIRTVNPLLHSAWRHGRLIFDEMSLEEIAIVIKSVYGLTLEFEDEALKTKRFRATFPSREYEMFFRALERAYDVDAVMNGDSVSLRKKVSTQ